MVARKSPKTELQLLRLLNFLKDLSISEPVLLRMLPIKPTMKQEMEPQLRLFLQEPYTNKDLKKFKQA